ncbi:MAG: hypothetical protein Q8M03_10705 [Legionella sp.]|nr:hypothetical protein [Legionella sp.]
MKFPLTEPTNPRYIYINPKTNQVHVLMPIVSGTKIGLDNTCKSVFALQEFFGKTFDIHQQAVLDELTAYKKALEFDIGLMDDKAITTQKEERLLQINQYITAVDAVLKSDVLNPLKLAFPEYPFAVQEIMKTENTNLHSIVLRPTEKDSFLRFVNPVFSVERDGRSVLYDTLSQAYQRVTSLKSAKTRLCASVLASPAGQRNDFAGLQQVLTDESTKQLGAPVDFTHTNVNTLVTKALIDGILGSDEAKPATAEEYIDILLSTCAPELFNALAESPFYTRNNAEELSIITQFFLASVNIHCYTNAISTINFGKVLDSSESLSEEVAAIVLSIYKDGGIEDALLDFINEHTQDFGLKSALTPVDRAQIKSQFTQNYSEIKKSPHFDEFILLDESKKGPFVSHQGSICLDFAEFSQTAIPALAADYFESIRTAFNALKKEDITPTNPSVHVSIELSGAELLAAIKDEDQLQMVLDKLPQAQKDEIMASPHIKRMQVPKFLLHVARGEQSEAEKLLKENPDAHFLLQSESFTDYSGRTFNCTAFEYAYWSKDTHMCRMLIQYMDEETKRKMLVRCEAMEEHGLSYHQNGEAKNSKHFDFKPLIDALQDYVDEFDKRSWDERDTAWLKVGIPERDLPAYVAHEYCRPDRSFHPRPAFNEPSLPRVLTFYNYDTGRHEHWFPLPGGENSGLGFDFALYRGQCGRWCAGTRGWGGEHRGAAYDLAAVSHLDEMRSADLTQLLKDLNVAEPGENLGMSC